VDLTNTVMNIIANFKLGVSRLDCQVLFCEDSAMRSYSASHVSTFTSIGIFPNFQAILSSRTCVASARSRATSGVGPLVTMC
jgi:hypothetical protein